MKKVLKNIVPEAVKINYRKFAVFNDFFYDYKKYINHSASTGLNSQESMQAFLIKEYHAIEKGLALRDIKIGFGVSRISKLIDHLDVYVSKFGKDRITDITIATLMEYLEFDKKNNKEVNPVVSKINTALNQYGKLILDKEPIGGTKTVTKKEILSNLNFDYNAFIKSRYSTRDFSVEPVAKELILDAISIARFTPSVCNRQAWKVFVIDNSNPELKRKFLNVQNGNKGFGDQINTLLLVTGKLSAFFGYERNQVFIDGGMFAMSIVLALHSKGLGACCLNTSYTAQMNEAFQNVTTLDDDIVPIMFIGVGNLKDEYKVAVSDRKSIEDTVKFL